MGGNALGAVLHDGGVTFSVWAPFASAVGVVGTFNNWSPTPMGKQGDVWSVTITEAAAGQEYKFVITTSDGREIWRNDPRALSLTTNNGNSIIVDTSFDWEGDDFKPLPVEQQIIYELHVGTFNRTDAAAQGTFENLTDKLDYLCDLGVTTIELMPIGSMTSDHGWGYTPDFMYAIESLYGSRKDFKQFVKTAHQKGIGVILDVVYNHIGPNDNDLWQFDGWSQDGKGGIYFYNDWRAQTPWGETRPDYGRPEVRQYLLDNAKMWLDDCHLDGLRVDSTGFIRNVYGHNDDPSNDIAEAWNLLQDLTSQVQSRPGRLAIAEDLGGNHYITKPRNDGGAGFTAQWEVGLPHVFRNVLDTVQDEDRDLTELASALLQSYNGGAFERVIYSDSHDADANGNSRLSEEISPGDADSFYARKRSLLATAIVMTAPGVPMLFQGQEFMEAGSFTDWRALDWKKAEDNKGILEANKHLVALRKNQYNHTRGLTGQSIAVLHQNDDSKVLAYHRWDRGGAGDDVVVILNFANRQQDDYELHFPRPGKWTVRFNGDWKGYGEDFTDTKLDEVIVEGDSGRVKLAPYSVLILSQD